MAACLELLTLNGIVTNLWKPVLKDFELAISEKYRREKIGFLSVYYDTIYE